jgi:hypothetical protein
MSIQPGDTVEILYENRCVKQGDRVVVHFVANERGVYYKIDRILNWIPTHHVKKVMPNQVEIKFR